MKNVLLWLLVPALCAFAQTGQIQGTIKGDNIPLPAAKVTLTDTTSKVNTGPFDTDKAGTYKFENLNPGTYQVSVKADKWQDTSSKPTPVINATTAKIDLDLTAAKNGQIQGTVTAASGNAPILGAKVTVTDPATKATAGTAIADAKGAFAVDRLPLGPSYQVSVTADKFENLTKSATVADSSPVKLDFALTANPTGFKWIFGLLLVYWFAVLTARYHNIAGVNRKLLEAEIAKVNGRLYTLPVGPIHDEAQKLVAEATAKLTEGVKEKPLTFFFWTRGHEISAWVQLHEAQRIIATAFTRDELIARLRVASEELKPDFVKIAETVDAALAATVPSANPSNDNPPADSYLRALLGEALRCIYDGVDDSFQLVFSWQNKAFTLLFLGSCVLMTIAASTGNALLMVTGLAGGLVSRLLRGARGAEIPSDYGANWTTLILSPIYGAFAGWFGVLILVAMKDLHLLGQAFDTLCWDDSRLSLALAFLFGFSERMFTTVAESLEKAVDDNLRKGPGNPPGASGGAGGSVPKDPPAPTAPSAGELRVSSVSSAVPGKMLTIEGTSLDRAKTAQLGDQPLPIAANRSGVGVMQLGPVPKLSPGTYDLQIDSVKVASAEVPKWSIDSVTFASGTVTINGTSLQDLSEPLILKRGPRNIALTKGAGSTDTLVTATPATAPTSGRFQLVAKGVFTGEELVVP